MSPRTNGYRPRYYKSPRCISPWNQLRWAYQKLRDKVVQGVMKEIYVWIRQDHPNTERFSPRLHGRIFWTNMLFFFHVKQEDAYSEFKMIQTGVPLGNVLGPLLYRRSPRRYTQCNSHIRQWYCNIGSWRIQHRVTNRVGQINLQKIKMDYQVEN